MPKGGPDGGDGGHGGNVVVICDPSLRDLSQYRGRTEFKAAHGNHGEGNRRHGATGDDLELRVPPGTKVTTGDGSIEAELNEPWESVIVARGGTGGRGNKQFTTSTQQAPRFAEHGLPGDEVAVELQLRLLADAGFVGLPNAGKSSMLDRMTAAAPKIADYPFTTLEPMLGTIDLEDRQLVLVDIPGLIEGAHEGVGLGHEFLAHVERCKLLVHVVDLAPVDGTDAHENFITVEHELAEHDGRLARLPRIIALNKTDLIPAEDAQAALELWSEEHGDKTAAIVLTSTATGEGLDELRKAIFKHVPADAEASHHIPGFGDRPAPSAKPEHKVYRPSDSGGFSVEPVEPGVFRVNGKGIELLLVRFDVANAEAMRHVEQRLRTIGVIRELERKGFESGDEIEIAGERFELDV